MTTQVLVALVVIVEVAFVCSLGLALYAYALGEYAARAL